MNYLLITPTGRIITFYIKAVALCYQQAYGGTLTTTMVDQPAIVDQTVCLS